MDKSKRFFSVIETILSLKDDVEGKYKTSLSTAMKMVLGLEPFVGEVEKEDIKEIFKKLLFSDRLIENFETFQEAEEEFENKLNNFFSFDDGHKH